MHIILSKIIARSSIILFIFNKRAKVTHASLLSAALPCTEQQGHFGNNRSTRQ